MCGWEAGMFGPRAAEAIGKRVLDHWIKTVYVAIRYFRVFIRLSVNSASQIGLARGRHLAQWWRNIVMIRGANPDRAAAGITCSLGQRFRTEWTTNRKQREQNADQTQQDKREDVKERTQISEGLVFSYYSSLRFAT